MREKPVFVGYGELMFDKIYNERNELITQGGGGSTWNILHNLAMFNSRIYAIGNCGNDGEGQIATQELSIRGINTDNIKREDKKTNTLYVVIANGRADDIKFSSKSPITGEEDYEVSENLFVEMPPELEDESKIIIIDRLRKYNLDFIKKAKNKKVALDLGKGVKKPLEELEPEFILEFLRNIDILQLNGNVTQIVFEKLGVESLEELYGLLNLDLLTVTNGSKCANFLFEQDGSLQQIHKLPEEVEKEVNSMGAGDAFFSVVLQGYSEYLSQDKEIDSEFVDKVFNGANRLARKVIVQMSTRYKGKLTNKELFGELCKQKVGGQVVGEEDECELL